MGSFEIVLNSVDLKMEPSTQAVQRANGKTYPNAPRVASPRQKQTNSDLKNISLAARSSRLRCLWGLGMQQILHRGCCTWTLSPAFNKAGATDTDLNGTPGQVKTQGTEGYVGFLAASHKTGDEEIELLGGNQNNKVSKQRSPLDTDYGLLGIRGLS